MGDAGVPDVLRGLGFADAVAAPRDDPALVVHEHGPDGGTAGRLSLPGEVEGRAQVGGVVEVREAGVGRSSLMGSAWRAGRWGRVRGG
ncbi:hypothetical protein DEGR_08730 [Deinococcus grandis]|nr:hypothetical protein DEGR_08730 [Deinococcus grandis]